MHGKKRWEDQQMLRPLPRYSPSDVGRGKRVSAGNKAACSPLRASLSSPVLPVISGEAQWPVSLAAMLLRE